MLASVIFTLFVSGAPELLVVDHALIDKKVDPCEDFYQFGCGVWIEKNPVPPDRAAFGRDTELAERNLLLLRDILEKAGAKKEPRSPVDQKIGDFYAACMDEGAIEKAGLEPLKAELAMIDGLSDKAALTTAIAKLHKNGPNVFFSFGPTQDFKNAAMMIGQVDQSGLGLPERDYYLRKDPKSVEIRKDYLAHVAKMLKLAGDNEADATKNASEIMELETALAKASLPVVERRDPKKLYHDLELTKLQGLTPSIVWTKYLEDVGSPSLVRLNVSVPNFFKGLEPVLKNSQLSGIKTYLRWHVIHQRSDLLPDAFVKEDFDFYQKKLAGTKELKARWKRCVDMTDEMLGEALGQAYVERAFPGEAKARTLAMVHEIEQAMDGDIKSLPWMSDTTKKKALEKLGTLSNKIGYPDKWRDYSKLDVKKGDALGNYERAIEFESLRQYAKIGKPVDRGEWFMTPPTVNAYYDPQLNEMNFPAGILQPPFYDAKADDAANFGDTGATIGHELTHGFDDEGRQFDHKGNLNDWWTKQDGKAFDERAKCVVKEYDGFVAVGDVKVQGKLTLGENIADLGGTKIAYLAFSSVKAKAGKELGPDAAGYTPEQRFFISFAQGWCTNRTDELLRMMAQTNPHSPEKYRVNGVVVNMPEFKKAFGCKDGSKMVAAKPCAVW